MVCAIIYNEFIYIPSCVIVEYAIIVMCKLTSDGIIHQLRCTRHASVVFGDTLIDYITLHLCPINIEI